MPKLRTFLGEPAKASFEVSLSDQSTLRRPFKGSECKGLLATVMIVRWLAIGPEFHDCANAILAEGHGVLREHPEVALITPFVCWNTA